MNNTQGITAINTGGSSRPNSALAGKNPTMPTGIINDEIVFTIRGNIDTGYFPNDKMLSKMSGRREFPTHLNDVAAIII